MNLGQKLLELRKSKGLSQEEVAEKLNVTRQTVSKWETDQSTPDFDKIGPLCDLYDISADNLLRGLDREETKDNQKTEGDSETKKVKKAKYIGFGVLLYILACAWIMVSIPVLSMNPVTASAIFLVICGIATYVIVFASIVYKLPKAKVEENGNNLLKAIDRLLALVTLIIYLCISFTTFAWHITWILWIVYAIAMEIVKLIFMLRGTKDEK